MGSYLVIIHKEGFRPVRLPVSIGRLCDESFAVNLYTDEEIPDGFVQVPAGKFVFQGDKKLPYWIPLEIMEIGDFFLAEFPVTCREYVEFLDDLAAQEPEEARMRSPRKTRTEGFYWPMDEAGRYHIPTEEWVAKNTSPDQADQGSKLEMSPVWWMEDWPVYSVSWEDWTAFAAWRSEREGRILCLPHELQWEKAARGPDGRYFPWGGHPDPTFCNCGHSHEGGPRPCPVDTFPIDESPYGARGLAGNSRDVCLNYPDGANKGWRIWRGAYWRVTGVNLRSSIRTAGSSTYVNHYFGGRLAWIPRLGEAGRYFSDRPRSG